MPRSLYAPKRSTSSCTPPTTDRSSGIRSRMVAATSELSLRTNRACEVRRSVAGSRPTAAHAASRSMNFCVIVSGVPHAFQSVAKRAAIFIMRGPAEPTRIGIGDCIGFGSHGASVIVKCSPAKFVRFSDSKLRTIWMNSSKRSTRSFGERRSHPYALCSFTCHPAPMPSTTRPSLTLSMVAACLARSAGWCTVLGDTSDPRRRRGTAAAMDASIDQHSSATPSAATPSGVSGM